MILKVFSYMHGYKGGNNTLHASDRIEFGAVEVVSSARIYKKKVIESRGFLENGGTFYLAFYHLLEDES